MTEGKLKHATDQLARSQKQLAQAMQQADAMQRKTHVTSGKKIIQWMPTDCDSKVPLSSRAHACLVMNVTAVLHSLPFTAWCCECRKLGGAAIQL